MFSIDEFYRTYETETSEIVVNEKKFSLLLPKHLDRFIDIDDVFHDFPLWAKIWHASCVLASHLAAIPADDSQRILEIGGGVGLVSIVAASFGHHITLSEFDLHALNFARANAHRNNCPDLPIVRLDWYHSNLETRFDRIVASEITYNEKDLDALVQLFTSHLKFGGEIILAFEVRKGGLDIFKIFQTEFDIVVSKMTLRSESATHRIILMKMQLKK